jgi:hypothetical protein
VTERREERKEGQPYSPEEMLSFDRIKRAMTSRVLDRIEELWQGKQPINVEQVNEVISSEWQRVITSSTGSFP